MVTLKDIAELAGVSTMTVSRVVNKQFGKVSKDTVAKVQRIIKEQGYVPNSSARGLSSKASRLIAVVIQGEENALEYPYNATMAGHICYYVQSHGYSPILFYVDNYREITHKLRTWNVEGAVFLGMFDENMRNIQEDNSVPLVFTDSYSKVRQVTNIGLDDYKGGELAGRYLIDMGHREIAFIGASTEQSSVVRQRFEGFRHALGEAGITLKDKLILPDAEFREPVRALFSAPHPPTAFFVTADIEAMRLMDFLRTLGLKVPEDCSVIGFDDLFFGAYTSPRLTTIAQDVRHKAQIAIDVLFRHIENKSAPSENIVLDVTLVERESVARLNG